MSWFNRKPRIKSQLKHALPYRTSPLGEKIQEETKKKVRKKSNQDNS